MVTNRFSSLISIINACIKTGKISCEVPTNKLAINVLRLLRDQGYIWGFSFVSPRKREGRLYPRVKIFFKYIDTSNPAMRAIHVFKRTRSNFRFIKDKHLFKILAQHKLYILSTTKGLVITSLDHFYNEKMRTVKPRFAGKLLAEVFI